VTADDIATFLEIAAGIPLRPAYKSMPLEAANEALMGLRTGDIHGALVLTISV
jgi:D-arabinose 1-dehydrogenase-like Zn-dependent alcohol dehydrogenase